MEPIAIMAAVDVPGATAVLGILADQGPVGIIVNCLIVALLVLGYFWFLRPLHLTTRAFGHAADALRGESTPTSPRIFPSDAEHLNHLWAEFLKERQGATVLDEGGKEISTIAPEEVFTTERVLKGYNRNIAITLAGVFTALGILGTFLGLVVGMAGLDMTASDRVLESVNRLLGGMSAAFYTSIFGIGASLVWLLADRTIIQKVQHAADDFFLAVRSRFPVEGADQLLHRLLQVEREESAAIHRSNEILEEQKAVLQTLGTDLAVAFQDAMDRSFTNRIAPAIESMVNTIDNLSVQIGDRQVDALRQMVEAFQERLSGELSGQFEAFADTLKQAGEWQQKVHNSLEELLENVQDAARAQEEAARQGADASRLFSESLEGLASAHERISDAARGLDATAKSISDIASALATHSAELGSQLQLYQDANEQIRSQLAAQVDTMAEQVGDLTRFWSEFREDFAGVGAELGRSITEFSTLTVEKLGEIFTRFDSEMAKVVQHLGGTLAEMREVTEDLPGAVERFRSSLETAAEPMEGARDALGRLADAMAALQPLPATLDRAISRVDESGQSLADLSQNIDAANQRLQALVAVLDRTRRRSVAAGYDASDGSNPIEPAR